MCSVGDAFNLDIDLENPTVQDYICLDCQKTFKGLGKDVMCPECKSGNVKLKE